MQWLPVRSATVLLLVEQVQKSDPRKGRSQARAQDHCSVLPAAREWGDPVVSEGAS